AESLPFTTWAQNRKKIRVCLPDEADFFTVIDDYDLTEYDVRKVIAKPDTAFDWKSTPQSRTQRLRKIVRETAHSDAKNKKSTAQYTKL
ncbi:hypothetical protein OFN64_34195, partial [Escherichia coli]|nr:hypothetical protein [Escherichia coli]